MFPSCDLFAVFVGVVCFDSVVLVVLEFVVVVVVDAGKVVGAVCVLVCDIKKGVSLPIKFWVFSRTCQKYAILVTNTFLGSKQGFSFKKHSA